MNTSIIASLIALGSYMCCTYIKMNKLYDAKCNPKAIYIKCIYVINGYIKLLTQVSMKKTPSSSRFSQPQLAPVHVAFVQELHEPMPLHG